MIFFKKSVPFFKKDLDSFKNRVGF